MGDHIDLARCDIEIARCLDEIMKDGGDRPAGALLGFVDWNAERRMIMEAKAVEEIVQGLCKRRGDGNLVHVFTGNNRKCNCGAMDLWNSDHLMTHPRYCPTAKHVLIGLASCACTLFSPAAINTPPTPATDPVNHPAHYGGDTDHEVIKCLAAWGLESDALLWNVVKYVARAGKKGAALEDLKNARFYLDKRIASMENFGTDATR